MRACLRVVAGPVRGGRPDNAVSELLQRAGQCASIGGGSGAAEADDHDGSGCGSLGAQPRAKSGMPTVG
jgi:hypothetical protein